MEKIEHTLARKKSINEDSRIWKGWAKWAVARVQFGQKRNHVKERDVAKAMATHSSFLAWRIPWTEEPGRPQSMRSLRVRHD